MKVMKKEPNPAISIIVPVHNASPFLLRCINSLQSQTIANRMEIILVENGSSDNSLELCYNIQRKYPNIKVLVSNTLGPSAARNLGFKYATAPIIGFCDSDDYMTPTMYEELLNAKEQTGADVAYCNYMLDFNDGHKESPFANTGNIIIKTPAEVVYDTIMEISTSAPWARIYDRSFFDSHKYPEGVLYEDHATTYKWMSEMNKLVHIDKPLYYYTRNKTSITYSPIHEKNKMIDFFNAEYDRIDFILHYKSFSFWQKRKTIRKVLKQSWHIFKNIHYVFFKDNPEDPCIIMLKDKFTRAIYINPLYPGLEWMSRIFRIKYNWLNYRKHII